MGGAALQSRPRFSGTKCAAEADKPHSDGGKLLIGKQLFQNGATPWMRSFLVDAVVSWMRSFLPDPPNAVSQIRR